MTVFTQAIGLAPLNHCIALGHYAAWKGWPLTLSERGATVHTPDGTRIEAAFDGLGRLSSLKTVLTAAGRTIAPQRRRARRAPLAAGLKTWLNRSAQRYSAPNEV